MAIGAVPPGAKMVSSLVARAREMETADPIIAYFCKLHAVQQILGAQLHLSDTAVASFANDLLDDIETTKAEDPVLASEQGQAILADDTIAQAYVDNFALKVFAKADKDIYQKTTTKATALGFMAAAVFFDVERVFQPQLDVEIANKIKYSKFQATRILKAYKEGTDPNDYEPPAAVGEEDLQDDDVKITGEVSYDSTKSHQLSNESLPIVPESDFNPVTTPAAVAPSNPPPTIPSVPPNVDHAESPVASAPPLSSRISPPANAPGQISSSSSTASASPIPSTQQASPIPPAQPSAHPYTRADAQKIMDRTTTISSAQKHAKFAISALNYEDISTAVSELSSALEQLRALSE